MAAPEWNFGHVAGVCDVAYIGSGDDARLVTCGADNAVYVRHPSSGEVEESFTEEHEDMVNVVAVAPDGKTFATGSDDACVKLFAFEDGKRAFESNVTRFSLPVRALAFSADGAFLAAGGEDACVKVIKMADRSVALTLQTRSKCVKSVSFDPKGQFLSATDDVGQLTVWALAAKAEEAPAAVQDDDDGPRVITDLDGEPVNPVALEAEDAARVGDAALLRRPRRRRRAADLDTIVDGRQVVVAEDARAVRRRQY